jgi:hypothetical protein
VVKENCCTGDVQKVASAIATLTEALVAFRGQIDAALSELSGNGASCTVTSPGAVGTTVHADFASVSPTSTGPTTEDSAPIASVMTVPAVTTGAPVAVAAVPTFEASKTDAASLDMRATANDDRISLLANECGSGETVLAPTTDSPSQEPHGDSCHDVSEAVADLSSPTLVVAEPSASDGVDSVSAHLPEFSSPEIIAPASDIALTPQDIVAAFAMQNRTAFLDPVDEAQTNASVVTVATPLRVEMDLVPDHSVTSLNPTTDDVAQSSEMLLRSRVSWVAATYGTAAVVAFAALIQADTSQLTRDLVSMALALSNKYWTVLMATLQ